MLLKTGNAQFNCCVNLAIYQSLKAQIIMTADIPSDEVDRLSTLRELNILDTDSEKEFDELTVLAAQICLCPHSTYIVDRRTASVVKVSGWSQCE
jgi:hypothetical protein